MNKAESVRELLDVHPTQKQLDLLHGVCYFVRRTYVANTNAEDIDALVRSIFLEAKHAKILASPLWLHAWLNDAIACVENGRMLT